MKKLYLLFLMGGFLGSFQGVAQQLKINQSQQIKDLMEVKKRVQPPGEDLSDTGV